MKSYLNFESHYIRHPMSEAWENKMLMIHEHKNGVKCTVESYMEDNYLFVVFESGLCLSIVYKDGYIKLSTEDKVRERDLTTHPCFEKSKELLLSVYLRHILGRVISHDEVEAVKDLILSM